MSVAAGLGFWRASQPTQAAAVTKYHGLTAYKQQDFLIVLETGKLEIKALAGSGSCGGLFLAHRRQSPCRVVTWWKARGSSRELCAAAFLRALVPLCPFGRMEPL